MSDERPQRIGQGNKIIEGLKSALRYAKCRHEFTYWEPRNMARTRWTRTCTKCKVRETRASETEPANV